MKELKEMKGMIGKKRKGKLFTTRKNPSRGKRSDFMDRSHDHHGLGISTLLLIRSLLSLPPLWPLSPLFQCRGFQTPSSSSRREWHV
jgi:hypothetical protein